VGTSSKDGMKYSGKGNLPTGTYLPNLIQDTGRAKIRSRNPSVTKCTAISLSDKLDSLHFLHSAFPDPVNNVPEPEFWNLFVHYDLPVFLPTVHGAIIPQAQETSASQLFPNFPNYLPSPRHVEMSDMQDSEGFNTLLSGRYNYTTTLIEF